jgi:hypothetical protein
VVNMAIDGRSTDQIRAPFRDEVNANIASHPDFPALKATVDRLTRRLYRSDAAREIARMTPEDYISHVEWNEKSTTSRKLDALGRKILRDLGLPREEGRLFRGNHIDWRGYERTRNGPKP